MQTPILDHAVTRVRKHNEESSVGACGRYTHFAESHKNSLSIDRGIYLRLMLSCSAIGYVATRKTISSTLW